MGLESATYINQLVDTNPLGSDEISKGDDHIKLIKEVLQASFPDVVGQASATIFTSASAPTSNVRGTIWYDTGNDLLKINTAVTGVTATWVTVNAGAPWDSASLASTTAFRATMSGSQTVGNTTLGTIEFNTDGTSPTSFDLGTRFNTGTYKYDIPTTGYYYLAAATRWSGSPSGSHAVDDDIFLKRTVVSGSVESTLSSTTAWLRSPVSPNDYIDAYPTYQVEGIFHLNATDTVHVAVYAEYGALIVTGGEQAYFQGFQIA